MGSTLRSGKLAAEIRTPGLEEAITIIPELNSDAFNTTPPLPDYETYAEKLPKQTDAAYAAVYEDGTARTIGGAHTLNQNLRGKIVTMKGVEGLQSDLGVTYAARHATY